MAVKVLTTKQSNGPCLIETVWMAVKHLSWHRILWAFDIKSACILESYKDDDKNNEVKSKDCVLSTECNDKIKDVWWTIHLMFLQRSRKGMHVFQIIRLPVMNVSDVDRCHWCWTSSIQKTQLFCLSINNNTKNTAGFWNIMRKYTKA